MTYSTYLRTYSTYLPMSGPPTLFLPPETYVIAAGSELAEGGGAHRHRPADCGAAQAANRRRKPQGERRASASLPRGPSSSACTTHPAF